MSRLIPTAVVLVLALPASGRADDPVFRPIRLMSAFEQPTPVQPEPKQPVAKQPEPTQPDPKQPNPIDRAFSSPFARGAEAGGLAARSYNENFDGDNVGVFYCVPVVTGFDSVTRVIGFNQRIVGTTQRQIGTTPRVIGNTQTIIIPGGGEVSMPINQPPIVINTPVIVQDPVFATDPVIVNDPITATDLIARRALVKIPVASRYSGIQITDNDSPRPTDRLYFGYQFYSDVGGSMNPGVGGSDLQRQTAGFEMTFLDGDASIGMRLPYVQQYGPVDYASQTVGDLSILFKYAFYNDRDTGDVASLGFVVSTPTGGGGNILLADGTRVPHSTLFQPWGGFVRMFDAGYVMGITNLIVPSDSRDPTLLGNSFGAGYFLYQNSDAPLLTGITPNGLIYLQDQVNLNAGATFRFNRASLSGSLNVPVVGPRPWDVEAISFININF
jgi:hypothetical protein